MRAGTPRRGTPDDVRMTRDVGRRALRDFLAVVQHDDAVRERHDRRHDVLDDQHGHALRLHLPDERDHALDLGGVEAAHDLVKQEQPRPRGERAGDLQSLASPIVSPRARS